MVTRESHAPQADINVTPFLDVLLVLIIIFLASMTARKSMDAQLPIPCTAGCTSNQPSIVLEVLASGEFLLNKQHVAANALAGTLHATFDARPEKIIQVAGHRDARYQDILSAMDVARGAGVKVISIPPSDSHAQR